MTPGSPSCSACGGPTEIIYVAPGDKAARCPYCGLVTDLPDDPGVHTEEHREEETREGFGTRVHTTRTVKVTRSTTGAAPPGAADLLDQVEGLLDALDDPPSVSRRHETASRVTVTTGPLPDLGDLPPVVRDMLREVGLEEPAAAPKPRSFWRRLWGR